ncbi:hypothetical protein ACGFIX_33820 [Nocardia salmonicida]|uniref:hypothetical protein n=1 Tax=Nocardia salmonicida TaxID=53431 RepID=UPI003714FE67
MSQPQPATTQRWSAGWGVGIGILAALILFVPATFALQRLLDVPEINATPKHLRAHAPKVAASYWTSWILAYAALLIPAAILAAIARTRGIAIAYAITAAIVGGLLAAFVVSFELNGFAPD